MRDRFECNHPAAFGRLALIESFGLLVKTNREVGRFDKGPSQIFVAVAQFFTADATAIGGEAADLGKASNIAGCLSSSSAWRFNTAKQ